jgi:hypothetical protein
MDILGKYSGWRQVQLISQESLARKGHFQPEVLEVQ